MTKAASATTLFDNAEEALLSRRVRLFKCFWKAHGKQASGTENICRIHGGKLFLHKINKTICFAKLQIK